MRNASIPINLFLHPLQATLIMKRRLHRQLLHFVFISLEVRIHTHAGCLVHACKQCYSSHRHIFTHCAAPQWLSTKLRAQVRFHAHIHMFVSIDGCTWVYIYVHMCVYVCLYNIQCIHTYIFLCTYLLIYICITTHAYVRRRMHVYRQCSAKKLQNWCAQIWLPCVVMRFQLCLLRWFVRLCAYMYICIYMYIYI